MPDPTACSPEDKIRVIRAVAQRQGMSGSSLASVYRELAVGRCATVTRIQGAAGRSRRDNWGASIDQRHDPRAAMQAERGCRSPAGQ